MYLYNYIHTDFRLVCDLWWKIAYFLKLFQNNLNFISDFLKNEQESMQLYISVFFYLTKKS